MTSLYLASGSPRRRELLTQIGVPFQTVSAAIDETPLQNESPVAYVERLARGIAMRVPALATGPTGDSLNSWADYQAAEQKAELVSLLVKRVERARASAPSGP